MYEGAGRHDNNDSSGTQGALPAAITCGAEEGLCERYVLGDLLARHVAPTRPAACKIAEEIQRGILTTCPPRRFRQETLGLEVGVVGAHGGLSQARRARTLTGFGPWM